jgi:PII-like signaling protein
MRFVSGKRLTVYTTENGSFKHRPLYEFVLRELHAAGVEGARVIRAVAGFGRDHTMRTTMLEFLSNDLPLVIEASGESDNVDRAIEAIMAQVDDLLIEVSPIQMVLRT